MDTLKIDLSNLDNIDEIFDIIRNMCQSKLVTAAYISYDLRRIYENDDYNDYVFDYVHNDYDFDDNALWCFYWDRNDDFDNPNEKEILNIWENKQLIDALGLKSKIQL